MKVGINLKIDVSKIDKERLYKGEKGTYLDAVAFIDLDNKGQYGDNGMITQNVSKQDKEKGVQGSILGNGTVFWSDGQVSQQQNNKSGSGDQTSGGASFNEDVPFKSLDKGLVC